MTTMADLVDAAVRAGNKETPFSKLGSREIAYSMGSPNVGRCPCCGIETHSVYACAGCFSAHREVYDERCALDTDVIRDAFYALGLRLRAEGKMPPLTKPGPAAAAVCSVCGGAPCDCEKEIWGYWFRRLEHGLGPTLHGGREKRASLVAAQAESKKSWPEYEYGPVQRISDPPWDFGKTSECVGRDGAAPVKANAATPPPAARSEEPAFSSAALARALFDEEMEAEAVERSEYGNRYLAAIQPTLVPESVDSAKRELARVLDVMWAGDADRGQAPTKPERRRYWEERVARAFKRIGRKP